VSERRVALAGPVNFRDLGGYATADGRRTRWGRLYRSDSLHHLTPADGVRLGELGVRSALDFRAHDELVEVGIGHLGELDIRHVHLPTIDRAMHAERPPDWTPPTSAAAVYLTMMEHGANAYRAALETIAEPDNLPAVFFCMAGKDRTGIFSAVLLSVLGVADADVVADYALTHPVVELLHERTRATRPQMDEIWARMPQDLLGASAATMEELLALARERWGSMTAYVEAVGVGGDTVESLRDVLLERT
jgi:protein-tyrosine phosphatase